MIKKQSIKKNLIYNTLYQLFTLITPFITAPYTARVLGAEGIGLQSFIGSISSYFILFSALGTAAYGQREIARCRDEVRTRSKVFWGIVLVKGICTFFALFIWSLIIILSSEYTLYYAVSTITIMASFLDISWFFAGNEDFKTIVIRNIFVRLVGIVSLFIFIKSVNDLVIYIAILALSTFFGNLSMWLALPSYVCKIAIKDIELKYHFKETMVYFIPTVAVSVYTILDKTMLGFLTDGTYENGYYEQAHKLVDITKAIIISINSVMYTRMSYLFKQGQLIEMKRRLNQSINVIFFIALPMIFGMIGIGKTLVPWFFGDGYEKVVYLIYLCMPLVLIIGLSNCLGQQYLTPSGQRAKSNKVIIIGAVINFCLNLLLIPKYESFGAAVASVFAELAILTVYIKISSSQLEFDKLISQNIPRLISAVLMFLVVYNSNGFFAIGTINLLVQIISGALVYFLVLILMKDELIMDLVRNQFNRIKKNE
ncbi:flippase [Youngiibacter multivorans]|uniref:O-antigen/teichoic acid export membrane protein n=1 Tax=Youngiibacter multivorans TaxID=937251 RepID=A0ABS4G6B3_9CLOT|nr:flippase [Youngiibacter multivorans]MBP1920101.1 O-antigen/teichoic acid export membrane protein [Youngiibacter multivorans]